MSDPPTFEQLRSMRPAEVARLAEEQLGRRILEILSHDSGVSLLTLQQMLSPWSSRSACRRALERLHDAGDVVRQETLVLGKKSMVYKLTPGASDA